MRLKAQGYVTGQFGKNHLGDRDSHLPTVHGFDEFLGNLYHLNAEEEPETYYYPKDPEFRKKYGPRGVLHTWSDGKGGQKIEDTGPLTLARMPTVDLEIYDAEQKFVAKAAKDGKPFFVSFNTTRMHVWTHLKKSAEGRTGIGLYPDGMVEHDDMVGAVLKQLDDLGIADNTIVVYGTDNGAETGTWPDGGTTPYHAPTCRRRIGCPCGSASTVRRSRRSNSRTRSARASSSVDDAVRRVFETGSMTGGKSGNGTPGRLTCAMAVAAAPAVTTIPTILNSRFMPAPRPACGPEMLASGVRASICKRFTPLVSSRWKKRTLPCV